MERNQCLIFDVETTGLSPEKDEILQLSIIDGDGAVVFDEFFKPVKRKTWKSSEKIHGITPEMVQNCQTVEERKEAVLSIFNDKKYVAVFGYNVSFDIRFMKEYFGIDFDRFKVVDVMKIFKERYRYADLPDNKLTTCADYFNFNWEENAHNSLGDCKATLYCYEKMANDKPPQNVPKKTPQKEQHVYSHTVSVYNKPRLRERTWFIILLFIVFWPVGLFLMWKYADWSKTAKVIVTVIVGVLFLCGMFV